MSVKCGVCQPKPRHRVNCDANTSGGYRAIGNKCTIGGLVHIASPDPVGGALDVLNANLIDHPLPLASKGAVAPVADMKVVVHDARKRIVDDTRCGIGAPQDSIAVHLLAAARVGAGEMEQRIRRKGGAVVENGQCPGPYSDAEEQFSTGGVVSDGIGHVGSAPGTAFGKKVVSARVASIAGDTRPRGEGEGRRPQRTGIRDVDVRTTAVEAVRPVDHAPRIGGGHAHERVIRVGRRVERVGLAHVPDPAERRVPRRSVGRVGRRIRVVAPIGIDEVVGAGECRHLHPDVGSAICVPLLDLVVQHHGLIGRGKT